MKIAVAILKPEKTSLLSDILGRNNYFLINNSSGNGEELLPNPFVKKLGGEGIHSQVF